MKNILIQANEKYNILDFQYSLLSLQNPCNQLKGKYRHCTREMKKNFYDEKLIKLTKYRTKFTFILSHYLINLYRSTFSQVSEKSSSKSTIDYIKVTLYTNNYDATKM